MYLVSRKEWGARSVTGAYTRMPVHPKGVKIHYTGSYVDPGLNNDHRLCLQLIKNIQRQHMDVNGWIDIGYSFAVCPHQNVFIGRGVGHVPAANGPGLNSQHYAVLALVGNGGLTIPRDQMLSGIWDAITYLRGQGVGKEIQGHRDGYATACPGTILYRWISNGCPLPGEDPDQWQGRYFQYPPLTEGRDVLKWQKRMRELGYKIVADGLYGPHSKSACMDFQRERGIAVDGVVGPVTWRETFK